MDRAGEDDWLSKLESSMMNPSGANVLWQLRRFVERHSDICGTQEEKNIRLHHKIFLESTCRTETRILSDGSGKNSWHMPEHDCPYPTCDMATRQARIVRNLEQYCRTVATITQLARENISVEVCFEHECSDECLGRHPSYTVLTALGIVARIMAYPVVVLPVQALIVSFASWKEYKERYCYEIEDFTGWKRCLRVADVALSTVAGLPLMPLSVVVKWTWRLLRLLLAAAGKLVTSCEELLHAIEQTACEIRRNFLKGSS